jgi:ketosteroid isomerase-like protein
VTEPGKQVSGQEAIRSALEGLLSLKVPITIDTLSILVAGDIAQTRGRWALRGTGRDGQPVDQGGITTEVWKRQPGGTWLTVIDDAWAAWCHRAGISGQCQIFV